MHNPEKARPEPPDGLNAYEKRRREQQERFLAQYGRTGNITSAAEASGVARRSHYNWIRDDALGYRARFDSAREQYADQLERIVHERLTDPTGNSGSDILLMFMLKALRPEKYREAMPVADDVAKDTLAELRKLRRSERQQALTLLEDQGGLTGLVAA